MSTLMEAYNTGLTARENQTRNRYLDPMLAAQLYAAQTKNKYLDPELAAKLYELQTNNKYLDEKNRLANQYQSEINKYYGQDITSQINQRNTETKFTPLKYAIEAENSRRNNSRFGDSAQLIRSINSMKSGDQELWLSDPQNSAAYETALKQVGANIGGQKNDSLLTPSFLKQFGLGASLPNDESLALPPVQPPRNIPSGMAAMPNDNESKPPMALTQPFQQPVAPTAPNNGLATPLILSTQANKQPAMQPPIAANNAPPKNTEVHPMVKNAVEQHIAENAPNQELSYSDRRVLARQSLVNQKQAGTPLWNRAQGAIVLEHFLQDNQSKYAPRIINAAKYAGVLGKGQKAIDKVMKETPQAYSDYVWVSKDFIPNLGNNIKVMEKLASSDSQRKALNDMQQSAIDNWALDPKSAIQVLNNGFDLFHDQAKATLKAAQPMYPGVLEKLNALKDNSENYLNQYSDDELGKMAKDAIAKGADPVAVAQRMEELKNGKSVR